MSFKRDGDDVDQLGVLRRRRVKELFTEDIPEDEALLTSNGRYACLVCANRPVFDTVIVLSQHRQGKKHQAYFVQFQEKKDELDMLIKQRKQEQYLKDGTTDIKQATTSHKGLGCGHRYDPRVKKKFQSQKTRVSLSGPSDGETPCQSEAPTATDIASLPGNSHVIIPSPKVAGILKKEFPINESKIEKSKVPSCSSGEFNTNEKFRQHIMGQKGPFLHDKQLKNIFSGPTSNSFTPMPYKRKAAYGDDIQCKSKQTKESHRNAIDNNSASGCASKTNEQNPHVNEIDPTSVLMSKIKKPTTQKSEEDKKRLQEKQELADKYLYYRGGGWKKNWKGEWIKDEDVEFDSDEEPPDLP